MTSLIAAIQVVYYGLTVVVFADILVSFFLNPFHPIRQALDSIVEPMLAPIRRVLPPAGMFDFSPAVLLILIQIIGSVLIRFLSSVR